MIPSISGHSHGGDGHSHDKRSETTKLAANGGPVSGAAGTGEPGGAMGSSSEEERNSSSDEEDEAVRQLSE
jgi:hypothetical protein